MKPCSLETLIVAGSGSRPRSPTGNTLKPSSADVLLENLGRSAWVGQA